eukprot:TRINITY_DN38370_c0_g1_i1.p1 TRINITY_DN38370_c0_g1~~TRINITY_DN38370_c0_g1_i1.p1  ORF type:complete len:472 (+),score=55.41 TRINITY_DN38370_c0_g1_i1:424-1839(+)
MHFLWRLSTSISRWRYRSLIVLLLLSNFATILNVDRGVARYLAWVHQPQGAPLPASHAQSLAAPHVIKTSFERGFGLQGFVLFSSYRLTSSNFVVIGLTALALRHTINGESCRWLHRDRTSVPGNVSVEYPGDAHGKAYEVAILKCKFTQDIPPEHGGTLLFVIEKEEVPVYAEKAGSAKMPSGEPVAPFASNVTYCSAPMFGEFHVYRTYQFLEFHRVLHGVDLFHIYNNGGIDAELMTLLGPHIQAGRMTITDVSAVDAFETWYAQVLVVNDCAYRSYRTSRWALFIDFDEFLVVTEPPHSIQHLLSKQPEDLPWMSFGSQYCHTKECTHSANVSIGQPQPWDLERLVFRQSEVHCVNPKKWPSRNVCGGFDGHRKFVINPRLVPLSGIHNIVKSLPGGIHANTDDVYLAHFRGWNLRNMGVCRQFIRDTDWIPASWARDFSLAKIANMARLKIANTSSTPVLLYQGKK